MSELTADKPDANHNGKRQKIVSNAHARPRNNPSGPRKARKSRSTGSYRRKSAKIRSRQRVYLRTQPLRCVGLELQFSCWIFMAGWQLRGYVQDSEEEEEGLSDKNESQKRNENAIDLAKDLNQIDSVEGAQLETNEEHSNSSFPGTRKVQTQVAVNGSLRPKVHRVAAKKSPGTIWDLPLSSQETDELQDGYYQTEPKARARFIDDEQRRRQGSSPQNISPAQLQSSSPLTIPPSTPAYGSSLQNSQSRAENSKIDSLQQKVEVQFQEEIIEQEQPDTPLSPAGNTGQWTRYLRHRNPIQLRPYAIENEKYRQTLTGRGVKPLRIAQVESQEARAQQDDSQGMDFLAAADSQDELPRSASRLPSSSANGSQESPISRTRPTFADFDLDGGDLPDVEAILRDTPSNIAVNGNKRRRVMPSLVGKSRQRIASGSRLEKLYFRKPPMIHDEEDVLFDPPLSPLQSQTPKSSSTSRPASHEFRIPRDISPVTLPTPIASSEPRRHRKQVSQASASENNVFLSESSGSEGATSSDERQEVNDRQLERVQRKIRGVLPASWLRLDLKTQVKKPARSTNRNETLSPERDVAQQRGVARPVASQRRYHLASGSPIPIIDSSSENSSDNEHTGVLASPISTPTSPLYPTIDIPSDDDDLPLPSDLWGEVAEDNRIDAMLPPAARKKTLRKPHQPSIRKGRQTKLTDVHVPKAQNSAHWLPRKPVSRKDDQPRISQSLARPQKSRFRPPDLSLLDVPLIGISSDGHAPSFIRVAQRTSRSRKDRGKSTPGRKYLRMTTEYETEGVNENLRSWREGTLKPTTTSQDLETMLSTGIRLPLQPCAGNQRAMQGRDSSPSKRSAARVRDTARPKPRDRVARRPKPRSIQTTLDNIIRLAKSGHNQIESRVLRRGRRKGGENSSLKTLYRAGHLTSSLEEPGQARPATLESVKANIDYNHSRSTFRRGLDKATCNDLHASAPNPLLAKFLDETAPIHKTTRSPEGAASDDMVTTQAHVNPNHRGPRKRKPRWVVSQALEPQAASELLGTDENLGLPVGHFKVLIEKSTALTGLGPPGTVYTTSFDIAPLPPGTCFSERTFIGSGHFRESLITGDLDRARGFSTIQHNSRLFRWGPWDDNVSTQLGTLIDDTCESLQQLPQHKHRGSQQLHEGIIDLLEQLDRYLSASLSFHDTVDRVAFLQRCKNFMPCLFHALMVDCSGEATSDRQTPKQLRVRAMSLCIVFAAQLLRISRHAVVPYPIQTDIRSSLQEIVRNALNLALNDDPAGIAQSLHRLKQSGDHAINFDESCAPAELLVVACHVLEEDASLSVFWPAVQSFVLPTSAKPRNDVRVLEACWERLFLVLPFLGFDLQGVLDPGRLQSVSTENWTIVKSLLEPVFEAYESKTHTQPPTINMYCRALFGRCFGLINVWRWRRCEFIIGVLFDFFAHRSLFHLPNEEVRGSPPFLSQLDQTPLLTVEPEDRCFHILLKIIGSGLQQMRTVYPSKKIRDIVWRLMPNHGRFLPKDQAIQRTDLDALRNHHDLLCTLYWASPSGFRPRPTVIQNLVEVENSHKEACRINIRAWSNLIAFQLTAGEPVANLEPFINWWNDLLKQMLRQHQNARTEIEEQARLAEATQSVIVSRALLESTVTQNQRQVEAMLSDVLLSMKNAINAAADLEAATMLLSPDLALVFNLFSARSPHTNKVIIYALDILLTFASKALHPEQTRIAAENDDSQDYGDWPAFEADVLPASFAAAPHLEECFLNPLRQLLSNCFGADTSPEDTLLTKVIDAWVAIGRLLVYQGRRSWTDYIGGYGQDSWTSLIDTEQTRRFSAYHLAVLIETDERIFEEHKQTLLKAWAASLLERELLLKYQHRLTSSLLNATANADDSVLTNPPFWAIDGRFQITLSEFSARRLSLVSNMLSNMRESVDHGSRRKTPEAANTMADYKDIIKIMMNTMKSNYQQLGQGSDIRGAYVDFVHRVVELLQQHTSSFCPIDRFFTDSSSFPLPATDPTYVVGQLRNYGMRLHDHRTPKQLAVFIQSVSERAAVDGQQPYLVEQLRMAITTSAKQECVGGSDLRSFLATIIFPAYVDISFSTSCGWILALPILQALRLVFSSMMADVNGFDTENVCLMLATIMAVLGSLRKSLNLLVDQPALMEQPKILKLLAVYFATIAAALPVLDYLCRISNSFLDARALMQSFQSIGLFAARSLLGQINIEEPDVDNFEKATATKRHADVQTFALQELRETLTKYWFCNDKQYYFNRGKTRREIVVDIGLFEEEKAALIREIEGFCNALNRMTVLRDGKSNDF